MIGAFAACTPTATRESPGQYVDDSAVTAKVKAAILAEPGLRSLQIGVETYKGAVQLSGFVNSPQAKAHAGNVTAAVPGVGSVRNDLVVK
jgi:osmotically-inducible protein OsmY